MQQMQVMDDCIHPVHLPSALFIPHRWHRTCFSGLVDSISLWWDTWILCCRINYYVLRSLLFGLALNQASQLVSLVLSSLVSSLMWLDLLLVRFKTYFSNAETFILLYQTKLLSSLRGFVSIIWWREYCLSSSVVVALSLVLKTLLCWRLEIKAWVLLFDCDTFSIHCSCWYW